jgi:hypothetical protein
MAMNFIDVRLPRAPRKLVSVGRLPPPVLRNTCAIW